MRAALSKHRVAPSSPTFTSLTSWSRPAFTPTRTVNFSTKAGLDSAVSGMQAGDLIQYNGVGVLTISSSSAAAYTIQNKNPASAVVFDFGCAKNRWNPSLVTTNYVKFQYTGTGKFEGLFMENISNLRIYGGEYNTGNYGGDALRLYGPASNCLFEDFYVSMSGTSGFQVNPLYNSTTGVGQPVTGITIRGEITRWAMNPANDSHTDLGTGLHALILHGQSGATLSNSTFAIYGYNPLQPGETSAGQTWPEGGGGSVIEIGLNAGNCDSLTAYAYAQNLGMTPNGTNPGSGSTHQTAGNCINLWGGAPLNGCVIGWAEGNGITGAVTHCASSGNWYVANPPIAVNHGRSNGGAGVGTNLYTQFANGAPNNVPYPSGFSITYNDCT